MVGTLWEKGEQIDKRMHRLTVGEDPVLDLQLVPYDAAGTAAHVRMLAKQGLIDSSLLPELLMNLQEIFSLGQRGEFPITPEQEDVHTAIESRLTERVGESGKRVHAARSRNDQVLLATRLFMRAQVLALSERALQLCTLVDKRYAELETVSIPGYTHMQPAMPSSFGLWLHSLYEALLEVARDGLTLLTSLNRNPLGSGAGFGTSLPIDRKYVAELLAFDGVQRSFIDVNNSRGRYEAKVLNWCTEFAAVLEKWACDAMLYSSEEFRFISLPVSLTTGSSIMPQKRNPDILELLRARPSRVRGAASELQFVTAKLPSSYHRDLQYTKAPLMRGLTELVACTEMFELAVEAFTVNREACEKALYPELYATFAANREVGRGVAFRDAYKTTAALVTAKKILKKDYEDDFAVVAGSSSASMQEARGEFTTITEKAAGWNQRLTEMEKKIFTV